MKRGGADRAQVRRGGGRAGGQGKMEKGIKGERGVARYGTAGTRMGKVTKIHLTEQQSRIYPLQSRVGLQIYSMQQSFSHSLSRPSLSLLLYYPI